MIRDTIKEQDEETVESLKDELNYLLVFVRMLYLKASCYSDSESHFE